MVNDISIGGLIEAEASSVWCYCGKPSKFFLIILMKFYLYFSKNPKFAEQFIRRKQSQMSMVITIRQAARVEYLTDIWAVRWCLYRLHQLFLE